MKSTPALLLLLLLLLVDVRGSITALPPCVLPEAPQHSSPTAKEERFSFIPASSPSAWYTGRTKINSDGSRSFDWEGTQMWINITGASYVKVVINVTDNVVGRFATQINSIETSTVFVGEDPGGVNEYLVAASMQSAGNYRGAPWYVVRTINILEPAFIGAWENGYFTFLGWITDGVAAPPPAPPPAPAAPPAPAPPAPPAPTLPALAPAPTLRRRRKIELLGDSISAGYGSRGTSGLNSEGLCLPEYTSGNYYTYNWQIAEWFNADLVPIAWSGKGMIQNCCDNVGHVMPQYWRQTLAGTNKSDWDFKQWVPDMMLINLGTNDFNHGAGPSFEANFTKAFVNFALTAAKTYGTPKLPIFVAQGPFDYPRLGKALNASIVGINAAGGNAIYLDLRGAVIDGCGGHPGTRGHAAMANLAIPQIAKAMQWV